jgi:hypothetical protein
LSGEKGGKSVRHTFFWRDAPHPPRGIPAVVLVHTGQNRTTPGSAP